MLYCSTCGRISPCCQEVQYIPLRVKVSNWTEPYWSLELPINAVTVTVGQIKEACLNIIKLDISPGFSLDLTWVMQRGAFYSLQDGYTLSRYMHGEMLDPSTVPPGALFCLSAAISSRDQSDPPLDIPGEWTPVDWTAFHNIELVTRGRMGRAGP